MTAVAVFAVVVPGLSRSAPTTSACHPGASVVDQAPPCAWLDRGVPPQTVASREPRHCFPVVPSGSLGKVSAGLACMLAAVHAKPSARSTATVTTQASTRLILFCSPSFSCSWSKAHHCGPCRHWTALAFQCHQGTGQRSSVMQGQPRSRQRQFSADAGGARPARVDGYAGWVHGGASDCASRLA